MDEQGADVHASFVRRRGREMLTAAVMLAAVVWGALASLQQPGGPFAGPAGWLVVAVFVSGIAFHYANWHCPSCGHYLGQFRWSVPLCDGCSMPICNRGSVDR